MKFIGFDKSATHVPRCNTFGQRSFCVAGPRLWNDLPKDLRNTGLTIDTFDKHLKTLLLSAS